jgi:hypothetical protein
MKALIISADNFEDSEQQPFDLPAFMRETMKMLKKPGT